MNLSEAFDVSPKKVRELRERIQRLAIAVGLIEEEFIRGGGKGGQKINKTANCVRLVYAPLGLSVRVQRERKRSVNRFLALRELVDQIEMRLSPQTSQRFQEIERLRRRKSRRRQRAQVKYRSAGAQGQP